MKSACTSHKAWYYGLMATLLLVVTGCVSQANVAQLEKELKAYTEQEQLNQQRFKIMDEMDFVTYTQQRWEDIPHSHADPVKVTWPDGRETTSLDVHIEDMKKMFEIAPNTSIQEHPVKTANGDWTAMTGILKGTVTSTGKSFEITMVTVAKWDGLKIVEEQLFWDNASMSKQMGFQ